jgi:Neprosin
MTRGMFCLVPFVMASCGLLQAQVATTQFKPFNNFVEETRTADANVYMARVESRVKDTASFEEMRRYVLVTYEGVHVLHSFVRDNNHFDCVPVMEQPSVRALGLKEIASPPPAGDDFSIGPGEDSFAGERPVTVTPQFDPEQPFDEFGNAVVCEDQTIPMARIALEQLTRFPSMREFFEKSSRENDASATLNPGHVIPPPSAGTHVYSFTYSPNEKNKGITDGNNLWSPAVSATQIFSLSQLWEIGDNDGKTQTAEAGWQVYPAMYNIKKAALFIYWTADGYNKTGCYNLTCPAFVQTNNSVALGAGFSHYSVKGGKQYEIDLEYKLSGGKWWFYFGGKAVGYYPASQYKPGTMATYSKYSEYGTEAVSNTKIDPREGSGQWSTAGFGEAAYHRNLNYFSMSGKEFAVSLTADQPSPNCYSITGPFNNLAGWGTYFYDGGPGGGNC